MPKPPYLEAEKASLLRAVDSDSLLAQFRRYAVVGGIAFGFDIGSLWFFTHFLRIHYLAAAGMAFLIGLAVNYGLCVRWVFKKRAVKSKGVEFMIFGLIGLVGLALNEMFMWLFTAMVGFHYLVSKIGSTVFVYLWNFFARRYSLFR